jgi:hypothetical protein
LTIADSAGLIIDGGSADITVSGNYAVRVFEIGSGAKLTLNNLTVANGSAAGGAGILNQGTLTVTNSTLSGNSANGAGGYNGGGIVSFGPSTTFQNTIVANSPSGGDCYGTINEGGHNLDSDGSCGFDTANNSLSGVDPMLGDLADNGGPTKTHALLEGSPAIDKGDPFGATTDQRGVARPQGAASDIGAFEFESTVIEPTDADGDGVPDNADNCKDAANADQADADGDGIGDACDTTDDTTAPRVSAVTPTGTGIGRGTNVVATFSEEMDPTSITKSTFKLFKVTSSGTTQVTNTTVTLSSDGLKATLNPFGTSTTLLTRNTKYKAVVTTRAEDLAGNALDQNSTRAGNQQRTWTFTTG